jgi:N-acyl-phosphatidylethanolamine-hydrolysing phospholipase D
MADVTVGTRPPAVAGRFVNLDGTTPDKGGLAVLRWAVLHRLPDEVRQGATALADLFRRQKSWRPPCRLDQAAALAPEWPHLTWIGHSTFLLRMGDRWILTDPVFGHAAGTLWRHVPPGLSPGQLPPIDLVTVSHDHFDHLDLPSLAQLKGEPELVAPLQLGRYLPRPATELDWWQSIERQGLRITVTPAHHWGMRNLSSRNRTLWGGIVFQAGDLTLYFAGDSALQPPVFQAIRARFPRIDIAVLPIGAYSPRWFMKAQHMDPEEAVDAYEMLGARRFVAMHWGTFNLSSEPIREPVDRLRKRWAERRYRDEDLWILDVGESRGLDGTVSRPG